MSDDNIKDESAAIKDESGASQQKDLVSEATTPRVTTDDLRQSLVAMATKNPNNVDVEQYKRRMTINAPTPSFSEAAQQAVIKATDANFRDSNPSPEMPQKPTFGSDIKTIMGETN